jgi:hypothetical protein
LSQRVAEAVAEELPANTAEAVAEPAEFYLALRLCHQDLQTSPSEWVVPAEQGLKLATMAPTAPSPAQSLRQVEEREVLTFQVLPLVDLPLVDPVAVQVPVPTLERVKMELTGKEIKAEMSHQFPPIIDTVLAAVVPED